MGMFDFLTSEDPNTQAQIALAAGLLGGRGSFNQIAGNALMGSTQAGQRAAAIKRQAALDDLAKQRFQLSLEEEKRRAKLYEAQEKWRQSIQSPKSLSIQQALAGGGGPTVANAQNIVPPSEEENMMYGALQSSAISPLDYMASKRKDTTPIKGSPGDVFFDPRTFKELAKVAPKDSDSAFVQLMLKAGIDPASEEGRKLIGQRLQKEATHQEPVSINNYGTPLPFQLPGGGTGYVQPPTRPGGPSQVVTVPGTGKPAVRPVDAKDKDLTEAQAKATAFLGQMRSASDAIKKLGFDHSALSNQAETALAGGPANALIAQKAQQVRQSQDQWSEAFLRFKTGAASTPAEVASNRKTFFPVFGDKPETIALKARMREQAEKDMEIAAGRGTAQLNARNPANSIREEADRIIGQ